RCVPVYGVLFGEGMGCFARRDSPCYLVPKLPRDSWPSNALALCPGSSHSGSGALGYLLRLHLGQRGQQGEQDIAHKLVVGGYPRTVSREKAECRAPRVWWPTPGGAHFPNGTLDGATLAG